MKLLLYVPETVCEIELTPRDDGNMTMESDTIIHGEVYVSENGLSMPIISDEDRKALANKLRDAMAEFIFEKAGYQKVEEG